MTETPAQAIAALREALKIGPTPGAWKLSRSDCNLGDGHATEHANVVPARGGPAICGQKSNRINGRSAQRLADLAYIAACHPERIARLLEHVEALTTALNAANSQAEQFERWWYLRGDALEKLQQWADAYPLSVFPEPDFAKAHEVLTANGMTLDAISASCMRYVIRQTKAIVDAALAQTGEQKP